MLASLSLKYRIALVIFVLEAIMMTAVLTVALNQSMHSSSNYQKANERVLLKLVSELSASALLIEEFGDLQSYFEQLTHQPDVVQIQLVDLNDIVVASSKVEEIGAAAAPLNPVPPNYQRNITVSSPAGVLGSLNIEFTNKTLTEANRRIRNSGIATAIIGMAIIFVIGILAGFFLTRRLVRISKAATEFASGNSNAQSQVRGRDELGNLGTTFDQMVKDVTEKQNQLLSQHRRIQLLMDSTAEGIIGIDCEQKCSFVNRAGLEMLGMSESELLNTAILQVIDLSSSHLSTSLAELPVTPVETEDAIAICANGRRIPVEFRSHPVRVDGEIVGAVCTFVDISQRKEHAKELALHREHLEELVASRSAKLAEQAQILDQIHDSVISTNLDGIIETWNKGAERLFSYDAESAIGKHLSFIFPNEDQQKVRNAIFDTLQSRGKHEDEVRLIKKDNQAFFAHISLSLKLNRHNEVCGTIVYAMDVSDRKLAEDEVHRKSLQLQMANKELESFSYSVSHDLRAPLRSIRGFTQCLSEDYSDILDSEGKALLSRIINGTSQMGQLIEDMLSLSRVTSYKMKWQEIDISLLAEDVVRELKESSPQRKINIDIEKEMIVHGDKHLLRILLVNLISNSWKYTSKNNVASISIGSEIIQNGKVFFVQDNGVGFNMKHSDKLFETFQRFHSPDEFEGTGVGLATAARVVQRHHGQIWAESAQGKGATFFFKLPLADDNTAITQFPLT